MDLQVYSVWVGFRWKYMKVVEDRISGFGFIVTRGALNTMSEVFCTL